MLEHDITFIINSVESQIEKQMKLIIKPKPKWLPNRIYVWLLKKLLVLEKFKTKIR